VWGGVYDNLGGEGRVYTPNGQVMGKWIKTKMTLYQKVQDGVYEVIGEKEGYISLDKVNILSPGEIQVEKIMESGMVLGEATGSGIITDIKDLSMVSVGTQAASLVKMLSGTEVSALGDTIPDLKVTSEAEKIILISKSLARAWNKEPKDLINQEVSLTYLMTGALANQAWGRVKSEKTTYKIGGVFEDSGKPMIYAPLGDMESLGVENYSGIKILVDREENLGMVRTLIQSMGLVTRSVADTLGQINRLFGVVRFLLGAFGSIALTVALFGMFNTLTVSLLERTREIGVMKSLGTSNMDVVRIFLTEAVMISTVGGIGGVLFGLSIGKIIDLFVFRFNNNTNEMFVLPWLFVLGIILVAFGVGLITGWYPSRRASKISALNALRYE
jgi:ABC-type antimicrobial peptide transport system permease subunit